MSKTLVDSGEGVQDSDVSLEIKYTQFLSANFRSRKIATQTERYHKTEQ